MNNDIKGMQERARVLIQNYLAARQGLMDLGILRSERNLQGDYAEWLVAKMLHLQLVPNTVQKGIDATDTNGCTYQIKSRLVKSLEQNTSFDFKMIDPRFDYLVCVFFSSEFEPIGIVRVPYEVVHELGIQNTNGFRFRWNKHNAKDVRFEYLFFPKRGNIPKTKVRVN